MHLAHYGNFSGQNLLSFSLLLSVRRVDTPSRAGTAFGSLTSQLCDLALEVFHRGFAPPPPPSFNALPARNTCCYWVTRPLSTCRNCCSDMLTQSDTTRGQYTRLMRAGDTIQYTGELAAQAYLSALTASGFALSFCAQRLRLTFSVHT